MDEIVVKVKGDTSDLDKKISDVQRKIDRMRQLGSGGASSNPTAQAYQERASADLKRRLTQDLKTQNNEISKMQKSYLDISKQLETANMAHKKTIDLLKQKDKLIDGIARKEKSIGNIQGALGGNIPPSNIGSGISFNRAMGDFTNKQFGNRGNWGRGLQGVGVGIGLLGSAASTYGRGQLQLGTFEERVNVAQSNTATNMLSEVANLQERGRGYEAALYGKENMKALSLAKNRMQKERSADKWGLAGDIGKSAGMILVGLGTIGASAGLIGTGIGAPAGMVGMAAGVGSVAAGGGKLFNTFMDDRKRSMITDPESYDKLITSIGSDTYKEQKLALKSQRIDTIKAQEYFERNRGQIQNLQRGFGMSDSDLWEGDDSLYMRGTKAGFTPDIIAKEMQAISKGGGTSAMSRDGGIFSAQMARGLNLSNAGDLLGKISGKSGGGMEASKEELIRIYSEATKVGLDASQFAKETRTFLSTAANIAYKSGTDMQTTAGMLGDGLNIYSNRGIQASASAFDRINRQTRQTGGLIGQYQIGSLTSKGMNNLLSGDSGEDKSFKIEEVSMLAGMPLKDINSKNEYIQTIMERRKIDVDSEQGKNIINKMRVDKSENTARSEKKIEALKNLQKFKELPLHLRSPSRRKEVESSAREQFGLQDNSYLGQGIEEQLSEAGMHAGVYAKDPKKRKPSQSFVDNIYDKITGDTGKMTDDRITAGAKDAAAELGRLKEEAGSLRTAFQETTTATIKLQHAIDNLEEARGLKGTGEETKAAVSSAEKSVSAAIYGPPQVQGK